MKSEAPTVDERPNTSKPRAAEEPLAPPQGHARYEVGAEIARGGMGRVVEANDTLLGRTVALKEALADNDDVLRRFRREIFITARLEHPSIVPVHDAGTAADGSLFYVMRKVTGVPLTERIAAAATLEARLALLPHVLAAAQAIAHAHRRGVIHRDIKPSNILVGELGETVVIDWGLAKVVGEADDAATEAFDAGSSLRTRYGVVFGTPGFMAPEQARGERVDARSDVYALGATLHYTFTRQPPHASADENEMMIAAASGPPPPISDLVAGLPSELTTIVDKSLAYDDRERYADAGELAEDLQRFLTGQLVASHRYSPRERVARFVRRNKVAVAIASIAIVTVAIGGLLAVRGIVSARDRADTQAALARSGQLDAEAAREREQQRGDQLLLLQARALAQTNPTASIAFLKQLVHPAERWDRLWRQSRAIAATATYNGVAHVLPGPISTATCRISPTAKRAVALGNEGELVTYDLEHLTSANLVIAHSFALEFADDDHLLVINGTNLTVVDLATGKRRTVDLGIFARGIVATPNAYWFAGSNFELFRVDPATLAARRFAIADRVANISASPDHRHLAIGGFNALWLMDLEHGETVARLDTGRPITLHWNRESTRLAIGYQHDSRVYTFDGKPPDVHSFGADLVFDVVATADRTYVNTSAGLFLIQRGAPMPLSPPGSNDSGSRIMLMGGNVLVVRGDHVEVQERYRRYTLISPSGELGMVASTSRGHRVISATPGHLLVWDLEYLYPSNVHIGKVTQFMMGGNDYAVLNEIEGGWQWLDLAKLKGKSIPQMRLPFATFSSGQSGTIVATAGDTGGDLFMITQGVATALNEHDIVFISALSAGGLAFISTDGTLVHYDARAKRSELLHHAAKPTSLDAGPGWLTCSYADGYVYRLNLTTGRAETLQLPPDDRRTVTVDPDGMALISSGRALLRWQLDGLVLLHATFPLAINSQNPLAHHTNVQTMDGGTYAVTYDVPAQIVALPAGMTGWFTYTAELGVYGTADGSLQMVDAFNGATWPMPTANGGYYPTIVGPQLSDDGHHVGALIESDLYLWDAEIPFDRDATARWLDQLTNATAELGTATLTFH